MESLFGWVGKVVEWFGQFFPRWLIIRTTHGGVKFIRGHKLVALGAGWHLYWPLTTEIMTYPVARQGANLAIQDVITTDGKTIAVGGLIVYEIKNIEAILAHTWDPEQTIKDIAMSAYFDTLAKMSWIDIRTSMELGTLKLKLRRTARKELDKYGVRVLKTSITNLVPTRIYRHLQSQSQDGV